MWSQRAPLCYLYYNCSAPVIIGPFVIRKLPNVIVKQTLTAAALCSVALRKSRVFFVTVSAILAPAVALAQVTINTAATGQYENSTNIFAAQGGYPIGGTILPRLGDSFYAYGGQVAVTDLISQQKLFADVTANQYRYDNYVILNHDDYRLDGGLNWKLGLALDGTLEVTRTRLMVPFIDVFQLQPALQTEQRETAIVGWLINPEWRIEGTGYYRGVDEPLVAAPDLHLTERSGVATLTYLGKGALTSGLSAGYLTGDFTGVNGTLNPAYDQSTIGLVANYASGGQSTFKGAAGYTRRTSEDSIDVVSGITGAIDYKNQLTGKTFAELTLSRQINAYVANASAVVSDVAALNVNWQATYKIDVVAGYNWTFYDLPGQGNNPVGSDRHDYVQYSTLVIDYGVLRWLELKPYANVMTRHSNLIGGNFNATAYGIYVTLKWQNNPP